ncbi:hypothetical protein BDW42DRAFT_151942 [Aspergillus taichungensis]|uniref:Extracellular membrane protein CFEM domain-containing protein n=1 Tax=Aspergillus taichungensis TaxID=482145 RepID=A0A2J5HLL2_9EURO|nr:hypothetical protein BDW42DRAFT_151942 [Aspergillus taichungensis]
MKLSLVLASLVAVAVAQSSTGSEAAAPTATLSPEAKCAAKCDQKEVCCMAACYKVPCPSDAQANDTTSCVAACPQGSGTPKDTDKYASCQASCYSSHFFPASATGSGGSTATSAKDADATATDESSSDDKDSDKDSDNSSKSGSKSSSAPSASETPNAASVGQLKVGASAAGLVGFALAAWAL